MGQHKKGISEEAIYGLALEHMKAWGLLKDWTFGLNNHRATMGICKFNAEGRGGTIELSRHFIEMNEPKLILDTLLHEIAHALAGPNAGHGEKWVEMCKKVGAKPVRCGFAQNMPRGKYVAVCKKCKHVYDRHRRPVKGRNYFCARQECRKTGPPLKFSEGG